MIWDTLILELDSNEEKPTTAVFCYLKTKKEKRNNEQPKHKTAHLQAPTHKPMLQHAKELFSCRRSRRNWYICNN